MSYFVFNLIWYFTSFIPYIAYDALGLDDLGVCGIRLKTTFLKIWFQINIIWIIVAYCISAFCGVKVLQKVRNHQQGVSIEFQV